MQYRLSLLSKLGALGGLFALMALAAFGASANSAAAAGPVASVSVAASAAGCGGQFTVVATVRDVQGLAPAPPVGVTISSSAGTIIGTTGITNAAGQVTATFMASTTFTGTGVVTASAGGITGTGPVFVNCGVVNPIYPVNPYPIYPINNCGYVGCVAPYYNNCAAVPYSPIYGQVYRPPCNTYPLAYNNTCGYGYNTYANPCNGPFVGGAPARVNLAVSPAIATCGSTPVTVSANITDAFGVAVANGTPVSFSSTMGAIGGATTIGGNATATLTIPTGSAAGVAQIRVTSGGASATSTVQVNCAPVVQQVVVQQVVAQRPSQGQIIYTQGPRPAPQQQPVIIQRGPAPAYVPPFAPPRTGEAGLTEAILAPNDDTAANQSLVDAWREAEYGVLDASQYDWVVNADDTAASAQLATDLIDEAYSVIDASQVDVIVVADDSAATTSMVVNVLSNPTDYSN